ncbi:hypothetical protein AC231_15240 [Clostridium pasteurianum]|uniref:hypothetical protein n=1 Tax=Clostridium pasteurianum TaxID=1501 RepID=UPI000975F52C|nr:hypothetical protein [Clostridium pasteurianum]OMH21760.1 hypothetical protein AC231_15240 [Clostridium pasteurianum]
MVIFIKRYESIKLNKSVLQNLNDKDLYILKGLDNIGCFDKEDNILKKSKSGFWLKKIILRSEMLKKFKIISNIFNRYISIITVLSIFINIIVLIKLNFISIYSQKINFNYKEYIFFVLFAIGGILFHEMGHISASLKYGICPKGLGIGMYFMSPVFFVDVDDTWLLSKKQRILIDVAGVYFQAIYTVFITILYLVTYEKIFIYLSVLLASSILFNLNPFLKYDGYWILSDYLGVYNLNKQFSIMIKAVICRIFGVNNYLKELRTKWSNKIIYSVSAYGIISLIFYFYFTISIIMLCKNNIYALITRFNIIIMISTIIYGFFAFKSITSLYNMIRYSIIELFNN